MIGSTRKEENKKTKKRETDWNKGREGSGWVVDERGNT